MSDDGFCLVLVLVHELLSARERDLVDVLVHLLGGHTDTMVAHGEGVLVFVYQHAHTCIAEVALGFTYTGEGLQLLRSVHGVTNQLTEKYLVVRVQELFDDGEDVV